MQAYCVKCRAKKEMKNAKAITMKNGKPATQGVCPTCGTKMFRIGKQSFTRTRLEGGHYREMMPAFFLSNVPVDNLDGMVMRQSNAY